MSYEPPPSSPDPAGQSPQYGPPADPYGPPSDPFNAPPPTAVWNPTPGGGDPYTPPGGYGPPSGDPYAPPGGGYGPPSGDPYAPPSGGYGDPYAPPGGGYGPPAPVSGYPPAPAPGYGPPAPVSGYPPQAPGYGPPPQGVPGYGPPPMSPVLPAKKSNTLMIVLIAVSVVLVLCCGGAVAALVAAGDEDPVADDRPDISTSQPTTGSTGRDLAPPDQTKNDPETENMKVGDTLVITSTDGDELRVTVRKVTSRTTGCREYSNEPDNGTYVVVEVTAEVVKGTASINPLYLNFVDAAGVEENSIGGIFSGCGEPLRSGVDLPAGTKREGTIVFDVKAAKGKIVYSELGGSARGSWTVG